MLFGFIDEWYNRGMKVRTSVTLSEELLQAISEEVQKENRSEFIEQAAWSRLRELRRAARNRGEVAEIDRNADSLNAEALDVLDFQDNR